MTDEEKLKALDPKNPFTQAIKDWANTPEAERQKFYERNAAAIDRWQAETDAMAEDDVQTKRRSSTALLLPYFSQISILRRSVWRTGI